MQQDIERIRTLKQKLDPPKPKTVAQARAAEAPATVRVPRRRLSGEDRERAIVDAAVQYFAEVGFDGDTRELARRMGVTQSLMFKYFPNKAALIEKVYQAVYVGRWNPYWEAIIADRRVPLQERLSRLYRDYAKTTHTREWVRIYMFSGLRGEGINQRYLQLLRSRILEPIAAEVRAELGLPGVDVVPLTIDEIELVWGINNKVFYFGLRRHVFDIPLETDLDDTIALTVEHFIAGARAVVPGLVEAASAKP